MYTVAYVLSRVRSCIRTRVSGASRREYGTISELDLVRNGWWARLGFGELAGFMGRWFYERIWLIHHTLTSFDSSSPRIGQGKGSWIASDILSADFILWNHAPTGFTDDELGVTLRAFLHGDRSPRVSDQPKRAFDGNSGSSVVVLHREGLQGGSIRAAYLRCAR